MSLTSDTLSSPVPIRALRFGSGIDRPESPQTPQGKGRGPQRDASRSDQLAWYPKVCVTPGGENHSRDSRNDPSLPRAHGTHGVRARGGGPAQPNPRTRGGAIGRVCNADLRCPLLPEMSPSSVIGVTPVQSSLSHTWGVAFQPGTSWGPAGGSPGSGDTVFTLPICPMTAHWYLS